MDVVLFQGLFHTQDVVVVDGNYLAANICGELGIRLVSVSTLSA